MADVHEKDYGHTGSFNPNYPTAGSVGDDGRHNGTLSKYSGITRYTTCPFISDTHKDPNYPSTHGKDHLDGSHDPDHALRKIRTAGSISISPELFEKIYLSPQNNVKGDLRKTFANPTPLV